GVARAAERLGYDSVWTNSHTAVPASFKPRYPFSEDGMPSWNARTAWADAMTTLGFVAAATERVRLGVAVVPLIITDPITLAKQAATVDVLSDGRFELGVGAGWLLEEARALGHPTDHRQARLEETVEVLRLAWTRPTFSYEGRFVKILEVGVHPQPPQGERLPLWIGGQGDEAVRIAAAHGAGLFIWLQTPARVAEYGRSLRALRPGAALARRAERVPERDRAAVHVRLLAIEAEVFLHREVLRREGLVDLDEIHVLDLEAGALERLAR